MSSQEEPVEAFMARAREAEKGFLLDLLLRGAITQHFLTRNYQVENWDGSTEWTRLMVPPAPGVVRYELPPVYEISPDTGIGRERRRFMTECARHFVGRILYL